MQDLLQSISKLGLSELTSGQSGSTANPLSAMVMLQGLAVLMVILVVHWSVAQLIYRSRLRRETRRSWLFRLRCLTVVAMVAAVAYFWPTTVLYVAGGLVVALVALAIAGRDFAQCFAGYSVISRNEGFALGDRIEVGPYYGDVIAFDWLSTTLMEVGRDGMNYRVTGRKLVLPNSIFLTEPVVNEFQEEEFVMHTFTVPVARDDNWQSCEMVLIEAARSQAASYLDDARKYFRKLGKEHRLSGLVVEPRVVVELNDPEQLSLDVRMVVPSRKKGSVEQSIVRSYLVARQNVHSN